MHFAFTPKRGWSVTPSCRCAPRKPREMKVHDLRQPGDARHLLHSRGRRPPVGAEIRFSTLPPGTPFITPAKFCRNGRTAPRIQRITASRGNSAGVVRRDLPPQAFARSGERDPPVPDSPSSRHAPARGANRGFAACSQDGEPVTNPSSRATTSSRHDDVRVDQCRGRQVDCVEAAKTRRPDPAAVPRWHQDRCPIGTV